MRPNTDRRQFGRRETNVLGWIKIDGRPLVSCVVRNLSPKGAFLELAPPAWLPYRFQLLIEQSEYACEIRHSLNMGVGVHFCGERLTIISSDPLNRSEIDHWIGRNRSK